MPARGKVSGFLRPPPLAEIYFQLRLQGRGGKFVRGEKMSRRTANRAARALSRDHRPGVEAWEIKKGGDPFEYTGYWKHRRLSVFRRGRALRRPRPQSFDAYDF